MVAFVNWKMSKDKLKIGDKDHKTFCPFIAQFSEK